MAREVAQRGSGPRLYRELPLLAMLAAILLGVQVALAPLPNIELVSLLVVLYTRRLGSKALLVIYAFVLLEGLVYGFGLWFVNYLYIWAILWGLAMAFRQMESILGWVVILGGFGLAFGLLCAIPYLFLGGPGAAVSYFLSGIPFDLLHGAGNMAAAAVLMRPLEKLMRRLYKGSAG